MGAQSLFGFKSSSYQGIGIAVSGNARGSVMGKTTHAAWVVKFHGKLGKPSAGASTATGQFAIYQASGNVVTSLVGTSDGTFSVTGVMTSGAGGSEYTDTPATPLQRWPNLSYALMVRAASNSFNHGQDHSGLRMAKWATSSFPNPFSATTNDPEGKMALWTTEIVNSAPKQPSNVSPDENGATTDTTPTVSGDFRDDEEVLPGFTLGQGDTLKQFRVLILDEGKTEVLQDSGWVNSDSTMRTNRRSTWTSATLAGGTYVAQLLHRDQFDVPSPTKEWRFSVNVSSLDVALASADVAIASPLRTTNHVPSVDITWHHGSGTAGTEQQVRIRQQDTDTIVRGPATYVNAIANGATETIDGFAFFFTSGWSQLTRGKVYRYEIQGQTGSADWSEWIPGPWFILNAAPSVPVGLDPPAGKAFTSAGYPVLRANFTDQDDDSSALFPVWFVRTGGSGSGTQVTGTRSYQGGNVWAITTDSGEFPSTGDYEWRTVATDAAGSVGTYGAWTSISRVTTPDIDWTLPATAGENIETGTPTLAWTVDRTQTSFRMRIYQYAYDDWLAGVLIEVFGGAAFTRPPVMLDSGTVSSGTGSYSVPAGILRNNTDYTVLVEVTTSDGLTTESFTGFTLEYEARPAVTNYTVGSVPGVFESSTDQESMIIASWDELPATEGDPGEPWASDEEFGGYVVRYIDPSPNGAELGSVFDMPWMIYGVGTYAEDIGPGEIVAVLPTRGETSYVDRTPRSGTTGTYIVTYRYLVNGIEWVESVEAEEDGGVTLVNGVLSDLTPGGLSVPVRFWERRRVRTERDVELVKTANGGRIGFQGLLDVDDIDIDWEVIDDEYGYFTAWDLAEALKAMGEVSVDQDGNPVPRALWWRDPRGRSMPVMMTSFETDDPHQHNRMSGRMSLAEVSVVMGGG